MFRLLSIGGVCLTVALIAACGGDSNDNSAAGTGSSSTPAPAPAATGTTTAPAQTPASSSSGSGKSITVHMKDFAFAPARVDAKVGETVKWINDDDAPHNATAATGDLKTKTFSKGGSDSYTLDEVGTIKYICTVHPNMHGTIVVTK
jgi:plastocyanin